VGDKARWTGSLLICTSVVTLLGATMAPLVIPRDNEGGLFIDTLAIFSTLPIQLAMGIILVGPISYSFTTELGKTARAVSWLACVLIILASGFAFPAFVLPLLLK
jgi:hypothetical protein